MSPKNGRNIKRRGYPWKGIILRLTVFCKQISTLVPHRRISAGSAIKVVVDCIKSTKRAIGWQRTCAVVTRWMTGVTPFRSSLVRAFSCNRVFRCVMTCWAFLNAPWLFNEVPANTVTWFWPGSVTFDALRVTRRASLHRMTTVTSRPMHIHKSRDVLLALTVNVCAQILTKLKPANKFESRIIFCDSRCSVK